MSAHPSRWLRGSKSLGFLAALLLVLAGTGQAPQPVSAAEPYPADFDPLYDLPLPPAWRDTADFATTAEALRDQIATAGKARVRVDLRLPAVEDGRLDEAQSTQWEQDQAAAGADLLDALPDGSYQRLEERPRVSGLGETGPMQDTSVFGASVDTTATSSSSATLAAPSFTLAVDEAALAGLMASDRVAQLQASAGNAQIAAGSLHSLYLGSDGNLWAWGANGSGQLGDGSTTHRSTPTQILTGVAAVAGGSSYTLALKTDGSLWAWGSNGSGQLGDGTTTARLTPTQVLTGVAAMAAGDSHTLALKTDGSLWAWGSNGSGQLGDGTTTARLTPTQVLTGVAALAAGALHTLALKTDGSLWAWGYNGSGQLGDGTYTTRITPKQVGTVPGVAAMAAGSSHTLALMTDGSLWAWGANGSGQLGDGTTTTRTVPKRILTGVAAIATIAAGRAHTLALKTDGSLWAWGFNSDGQLGDGTNTTRTTPQQILTGVAAIAAGDYHTLALKTDGSLWAWGYNSTGQLGDGTTTTRYRPTQLTGVANDPPAAPTQLGAQAVSTTSITLAWTDASGNEAGFQVERRSGTGAWALLATLGANSTGYADAGLSEASTYVYRVLAFNTAGNSIYSNEASANTLILVTATAGANGTISPATRTVAHGATTTFTVTPTMGYSASVTGCGGTLSGTSYTTGPITAASRSPPPSPSTATPSPPRRGTGVRRVANRPRSTTTAAALARPARTPAMSLAPGAGIVVGRGHIAC